MTDGAHVGGGAGRARRRGLGKRRALGGHVGGRGAGDAERVAGRVAEGVVECRGAER